MHGDGPGMTLAAASSQGLCRHEQAFPMPPQIDSVVRVQIASKMLRFCRFWTQIGYSFSPRDWLNEAAFGPFGQSW